jgi:uncharacterized protein (DUF3084 family)
MKMINALNPPTPPAMPTNEALASAFTLLAVAADPAGTRARLDELTEQVRVVHSAVAEYDAARKAAEDAQAALADLHARELALADKQVVLEQATTQASVASSALAAREQKLAAAEAAMAKRESEIAGREDGLAAKLAVYRKALA